MRSSLLLALCCAVLALSCGVASVQSQDIDAPQARADIDQRADEMGLVELDSLSAADAAEEAADAAEAAADAHTALIDQAMLAEDEAVAVAAAAPVTQFSMDENDKERVLVEAMSQDGVSSPFTDKLKAKAKKLKAAAKAAGAKVSNKAKTAAKKAAAKLKAAAKAAGAKVKVAAKTAGAKAKTAVKAAGAKLGAKVKAAGAKVKAAAKAAGVKVSAKLKAGAASLKSKMQATMNKIKSALLGTPKPAAVAAAAAAALPKKPVAASAVKQTKIPKFVASRAATARDLRLQRQAKLAKAKLAREAADAVEYAKAVKLSWQSKKFERPLYSEPVAPAASSQRASLNGDRNFNTLFPAATPLSDGKASSQDSDFQHAGEGDLYVGHTGMIQNAESNSSSATSTQTQRPRGAQAPEPCAEQCEGKGLWRTAPCQDCIVRGMTNGWIVKAIQEQQKGYNYVHYARNQCAKYANDQHLKATVKGAPFAACFFQKMHETCNL